MAGYLHIVLAAQLDAGRTSLSWRVKEALEAQGHTVFLFTPDRWPWLFESGDATEPAPCATRLKLEGLSRFLEVQRPDLLLVGGGVGLELPSCGGDAPAPRVLAGALVANRRELAASVAAGTPRALEFAIAVSSDKALTCAESLGIAGFDAPVLTCAPRPDGPYVSTPLANDVANGPTVMCLQDATPARLAFVRDLAARPEFAHVDVCCFGAGWPEPFRRIPEHTAVTYAARSSLACVVFEGAAPAAVSPEASGVSGEAPADALLTDARLALVQADGAPLVRVGAQGEAGAGPSSSPAADQPPQHAAHAPDLLSPADAIEALASRVRELGTGAAARFARVLGGACPAGSANPIDTQSAISPETSQPADAPQPPLLEADLQSALARLQERYAPEGLVKGSLAPRTVVCVLGYFGMGNFGDEYILATVAARMAARVPGCVVVAVGENPEHTLRARGIYAVTLADKHVLDELLAHACAALVTAGLLFDQGIRWTMGKAELVSSMPHTDIPGIAAYAELAWLNGAAPVFYGAGAGPLQVAAGRSLVRLIGKLDTLFLTRDEETTELIRSCGVSAEQVVTKADSAFLGEVVHTAFVDAWLEREQVSLSAERLVLVSLREYENAPADLAQRVARALDAVAVAHGDVQFAACVLDPEDLVLAQAVGRAMAAPARLHVFDADERIEPLADLCSRAAAGLSMRYHCSLLLGSFGKPCVGLGYLPKVTSLYEDLGEADTLLQMDADAAQITAGLETVLAPDAERAARLGACVEVLRARSREAEDVLVGIVEKIAPAKAGALPAEFFLRTIPASELDRWRVRAELDSARAANADLARQRDEALALCAQVQDDARVARASWSYRLGNALLRPLSALKRLVRAALPR